MVDLLRAAATLLLPMDVDGAFLRGPKGKEKMNDIGKGKTDDSDGKGMSKGRGKKGKETRVCHQCNKLGHLRRDCSVCKKRIGERKTKRKSRHQLQCKEQWSKRGSTLKRTTF